MARDRERRRDGGVDVRPGDMSGRVDHDHDHEAERRRDARRSERRAALVVEHDRATAGEDEREGGERLGETAPGESQKSRHKASV